VNRWTTTGMLAASATTNETAFMTYKVAEALGIVGFDNQARV
jgi:formate dehydrogenase major subunit